MVQLLTVTFLWFVGGKTVNTYTVGLVLSVIKNQLNKEIDTTKYLRKMNKFY